MAAGNEFQIFVVLTFVFGGLFFLETIGLIIAKYALGYEGMHFLKRRLNGTGVDNIRHEPVSNKLVPV